MPPRRTAVQETEPPAGDDRPAYDETRLCRGSCNYLWRKHGKGIPTEGEPYLCSRCVKTLGNEILGLDTLAAMVTATADGQRGSTASDAAIRAHRGANSRPSPSPSGDTTGELESELVRWMRIHRPKAIRLGFYGRSITEACSWLYTNLHLYTEDADNAGAFFDAIHSWHGRLVKATKSGPALYSKPLPCPRCQGGKSLVQEAGSEIVYCTNCNRHMSVKEYEALAADAAEAASAGAEPSPAARKAAASRAKKATAGNE